jgi:hypothetical protein
LISDEVWRKLDAAEVSLEEEESLEVGSFEVDGASFQFDGETVVETLEEGVFVSTDGYVFELGG